MIGSSRFSSISALLVALIFSGSLFANDRASIGPKPDDPLHSSQSIKSIGPKPDDPLQSKAIGPKPDDPLHSNKSIKAIGPKPDDPLFDNKNIKPIGR
jgi:hypothetical protein